SPHSVALMQLRFTSLVVINSRWDFHPRVRPCWAHQTKSPAFPPGFCVSRNQLAGSGRFFLGSFVGAGLIRRLRTAARTLGERAFDLLDRLGLGDALHRRDLAREP